MARDRQTMGSTPPSATKVSQPIQANSRTGKEDEKDVREEDREDKQDDVIGDVSMRTRNQIDRALMHLGFLEKEIAALSGDDSPIAGLARRTASKHNQQFDGPTPTWPPLKVIRSILLSLKDGIGTATLGTSGQQ